MTNLPPDLDAARQAIDALDEQIMELIGRRLEICRGVAAYKAEHDLPMMQPARVVAVKQRCAGLGQQHGVAEPFTHALYTLIIDEACRLEDDIIARLGADAPGT